MDKKKLKQKSQKVRTPFDLYFLIISTIIVLPFVYTTKVLDPGLAPRLFGLGIITLILLLVNLFTSIKNRPELSFVRLHVFPVFGLYLVWSVISLTQAITPAEGLFDIARSLLSLTLLILATQTFINYKNWISLLVKCVVVSSIIATSIGLYQYFESIPGNVDFNLFMALYEIKGLMGHKNLFAMSLFLMLPFVIFGIVYLKKWWKVLSISSLTLLIINILLLQTRSVWIASIIFVIVLLVIWGFFALRKGFVFNSGSKKQVVLFTAGFLIIFSVGFFIIQKTGALQTLKYKAVSIFNTDSHDNQGRLQIWESTLHLSQDHLLLGVGAGNWKIEIPPYFPYNYDLTYQNWRRPHNDYLWVLAEKGIPGLALYILIFIITVLYGVKVLTKETDQDTLIYTALIISGIMGYMAFAFFDFPLERINHQVYLMMMMASVISIYYRHYPAKSFKNFNSRYVRIHVPAIVFIAASIYFAGVLLKMEFNVHQLFGYRNAQNWKKIIELADKAFTKLTPIDAFSSPIHLHSGEAELQLKNYNRAMADLTTALDYSPNHVSILNDLAIVSAEMHDTKKAIGYLDKCLSIYPKYEPSLYNKVNVYYRNKEYANAYVSLLNCNTMNPRADYKEFMKVMTERVNH
ncbi:MAG: hypothetical protein CVT99_00200 [Bacteroidetes bacterium HGW-Bacteroidetes-16]|jgi:O-antigen ligase|nr:MAG: hypothetical protein CVT99_00200 [Bacteroidetes bacterium HGW-Bacteroidetes-16]